MKNRVGQTVAGKYCDVPFTGNVVHSWKFFGKVYHNVELKTPISVIDKTNIRDGIVVAEKEIEQVINTIN